MKMFQWIHEGQMPPSGFGAVRFDPRTRLILMCPAGILPLVRLAEWFRERWFRYLYKTKPSVLERELEATIAREREGWRSIGRNDGYREAFQDIQTGFVFHKPSIERGDLSAFESFLRLRGK